MKVLATLPLTLLVAGCALGTAASTAVQVVTLPVKVVSKTVDLATTSQAEADQKRGRQLREADERRARELRQRCNAGQPLPTDNCAALRRR